MLPELQAERQMLAIEAASVPQMEQRPRAVILGRYERRLRGSSDTTTAKTAHEALQAAGIPVKQVPRKDGNG